MMLLDVSVTDVTWPIVLLFLTTMLVILVVFLVKTLVSMNHLSTERLYNQLIMTQNQNLNQESMIQSLINQIRSMDPMTLMNLQSTTTPGTSPQSVYEPASYVSHSDEAEAELIEEAERMRASGSFVPFGEALRGDGEPLDDGSDGL